MNCKIQLLQFKTLSSWQLIQTSYERRRAIVQLPFQISALILASVQFVFHLSITGVYAYFSRSFTLFLKRKKQKISNSLDRDTHSLFGLFTRASCSFLDSLFNLSDTLLASNVCSIFSANDSSSSMDCFFNTSTSF